MEDKRFDNIIEKLIEEYKIKYSQDSWRRLEKKLDHEDHEDILFDIVIANKLNNYSIPVSSGAFKKFETKSGFRSARKFSALKYFAGIAAVLLFIIFSITILNNLDTDINKNKTDKSQSGKVNSDIQNQIAGNIEYNIKIKGIAGNIPGRNSITDISNTDISKAEPACAKPSEEKIDDLTEKQTSFQNEIETSLINRFEASPGVQIIKSKESRNLLTIYELNEKIEIPFKIDESASDIPTSTIKNKTYLIDENNKSTIPEINQNGDESSKNELNIPFELNENIGKNNAPKKNSFNLSINANPTLYFIKTPNDPILNLPGYSNWPLAYNFGLTIAKSLGKNEIATGIQYYSLTYNPKKVIVSSGEKSFWMDEISFTKIGIPLVYSYKIIQNKVIGFYISGGFEVQMIINSRFKFIENEQNGNNLSKLASELLASNDFRQTVYAEKKYNVGILEGGMTSSNTGLTGKIGFGFERILSPTLSFFVEPEASLSLINKNFGPNNDEFISLNFKTGIIKKINL